MNLIEQQNILKGLTDESLQAELSTPSSGAPPFLIASEVSRRKSQRERYDGARAKAQPSTVMEDLMGGMAPPSMGGQPPAAAPAGLAAAMPQMGGAPMPEQTAFAEGGLVGALDYDAIGKRYAETLDGLGERRDRARALALLAAGAGMMSGGSSNTLTNIGKGVAAGTTAYGGSLDQIDQDEQRALAGALDLARVQQGDELQRLQFDWTKDRAGQEDALRREEISAGRKPASVVAAEWYANAPPEDRAAYDKQNPPPLASLRDPLAEQFNDIYQQVDKAYPPLAEMDTIGKDAAEVDALIQARAQKIVLAAYNRIKATLGPEAAARYARQAGLNDGDALTGGPATAPIGGNDPLGLGL